MRILIADDNRDGADSLAILMTMIGHEVRVAYEGRAALATAEWFHPHVALLDIGMPELNGYEVAAAMRARPWGTSIGLVAISGWGQARARELSRAAGFDHHLMKPVEPDVLETLLVEIDRQQKPT